MSKFIKISQAQTEISPQSAQVIQAISKSKPGFTIEDITAELYRISKVQASDEQKNKLALEYLQKVNASLSSLQSLMKNSPEISSALANKGVKL